MIENYPEQSTQSLSSLKVTRGRKLDPLASERSVYEEVSLIDLVIILLKHKQIILITFLIPFVIGFVVIMATPSKFKLTTVLEVGSYTLPDENGSLKTRQPIETIQNTKSMLELSIIPKASQKWKSTIKEYEFPNIKARSTGGANLIELSTVTNVKNSQKYKDALLIVAKLIIQDHRMKTADISEQLFQYHDSKQVMLKKLQANLTSKLKNKELLEQKLKHLDLEKVLYQDQIQRITNDIKYIEKNRKEYLEGGATYSNPILMIFMNDSITELRQERLRLETILTIDTKNIESSLLQKIQDAASVIEELKAEIAKEKSFLNRYDSIDVDVDTSSSKMRHPSINLFPTTISLEPYLHSKPVGLSASSKVLLLLLGSFFFSILSCTFSEIYMRIKLLG